MSPTFCSTGSAERQVKPFKNTCAVFCQQQSHALEILKSKSRKEPKFEKFLADIESHPLCRRLQLKDLIPTSMQRLTKYPLLIENLMKYTQANTAEHENLQKAMSCSKSILNYVNQSVKDCENLLRLADMQRRLDMRPIENSNNPIVGEYKNLDLTTHKLVYDGPLTWRIGRSKQIDIHVILLEDILVLLQKQDEKLVLKCHSTTMVTGKEDTKFTHSPIIKLANLLTRNVATDKKAFFLVSTSAVGPQIYELVALSSEERRRWFKHITEAADTYKKNNKDAVPMQHHHRHHRPASQTPAPPVEKEPQPVPEKVELEKEEGLPEPRFDVAKSNSADSLDENVRTEEVEIDQSKLILPNQVVVADTVLETSETVNTPLEMIRSKDQIIRQALQEKQQLVAEVLQLPVDDFENVAEMAAEVEGEKDARELVLASILQTNRLSSLLSDSIRLPEDTTPSDQPAPSLEESSIKSGSVSSLNLPPDVTLSITSSLNSILTQLLGVITSQDEEKERLSAELKVMRTQLASGVQLRGPLDSCSQSRPNSYISITSSASDVAELADDIPQAAAAASDDPTFLVSPGTTSAPFSLASHMTVHSDTAVSVVQESDMVQLQEPVCVHEALLVHEPVTVQSQDHQDAATAVPDTAETAVMATHAETGYTAQVHVTDIDEESAIIAAEQVGGSVGGHAFSAEQMLHSAVDVLIERGDDLAQTAEDVHIAQRVIENDAVVVQQADVLPTPTAAATTTTTTTNTDSQQSPDCTDGKELSAVDGTSGTTADTAATTPADPAASSPAAEGEQEGCASVTEPAAVQLATEQMTTDSVTGGQLQTVQEQDSNASHSSTDDVAVTEDHTTPAQPTRIAVVYDSDTQALACPAQVTIGQATETESSSDADQQALAKVSESDYKDSSAEASAESAAVPLANPVIYVEHCSEETDILADDDDDEDAFEDCEQELRDTPSSDTDQKQESITI